MYRQSSRSTPEFGKHDEDDARWGGLGELYRSHSSRYTHSPFPVRTCTHPFITTALEVLFTNRIFALSLPHPLCNIIEKSRGYWRDRLSQIMQQRRKSKSAKCASAWYTEKIFCVRCLNTSGSQSVFLQSDADIILMISKNSRHRACFKMNKLYSTLINID